jgi:hypothetical protein
MNYKLLVKLSNIIGVTAILLLVYWVFIFISITVFGLKVFQENITETFYLSVIGILALMFGALIINLMFNLTRIAEKHNQDEIVVIKKTSKRFGLFFGLSFPVIFGLLFVGNYLTSIQKEKMLIASAKSIIENNVEKSNMLLNYSFNEKWIIETTDILDIYSNTDTHFPIVSVIVPDSIDNIQLFLGFSNYSGKLNDTIAPIKKNFIKQTTKEEREFLKKVFFNNYTDIWFSANEGSYELFYPYFKEGKKIVLYFSDHQRYGRSGS